MKPSRKLNRGSFMSRVSGGAPKPMGGSGKSVPETDHDLLHPGPRGAAEAGADPDGGPHRSS